MPSKPWFMKMFAEKLAHAPEDVAARISAIVCGVDEKRFELHGEVLDYLNLERPQILCLTK